MTDRVFQDLRYSFRMMTRNPGITILTVLMLAIGIGVNTSLYSLMDAVLFPSLAAVGEPERVTSLYTETSRKGARSSYGRTSYPDYEDYRDQNKVFSGLAAFRPIDLNLAGNDRPERIQGEIISENYFAVMGVQAHYGRMILPEDDRGLGSNAVTVVSHELWRRRFGSNPNLVGKTIILNQKAFTVVGVAPKGFRGASLEYSAQVWVPINQVEHFLPAMGSRVLESRGWMMFQVVGRLKNGVSLKSAESHLNVIGKNIDEADPHFAMDRRIHLLRLNHALFSPEQQGNVKGYLHLLALLVFLVLMIACVNVAILLLARASSRSKEMAIRLAVGGRRGQLARQLLTESVLLTMLGGAAGLVLAFWIMPLLKAIQLPVDLSFDVQMNSRVLLFTALISILTGIAFGLIPALRGSRLSIFTSLQQEVLLPGGTRKTSIRELLVMAQVGLSLMLLIGAGLLIMTLKNLHEIQPGFTPQNVLTAEFDLHLQGYDKERGWSFSRQLVERIAALPGVNEVSMASFLPMQQETKKLAIFVEGAGTEPVVEIEQNIVAPNYFHTMQIPLIQGRDFTYFDKKGAPWVVMINKKMADQFWPGQNPIGKKVSTSGPNGPFFEVTGVVGNSKYLSLRESPQPALYWPYFQIYELFGSTMTLIVRTDGKSAGVANVLRHATQELDRSLPLYELKTLTEQLYGSITREKQLAFSLSIFAILAVVLAATGLYGALSYSITRRIPEFGIRMVLGAQRADILRDVMMQGMKILAVGIGFGLLGASMLADSLKNFLYGVQESEPIIYIGIVILLAAVAMFTCFLPARRATKVDPMTALRYE